MKKYNINERNIYFVNDIIYYMILSMKPETLPLCLKFTRVAFQKKQEAKKRHKNPPMQGADFFLAFFFSLPYIIIITYLKRLVKKKIALIFYFFLLLLLDKVQERWYNYKIELNPISTNSGKSQVK